MRPVPTLLLVLGFLIPSLALAEAGPSVLAHQATLVFDVPAHRVEIADQMRVPAEVATLRLGEKMVIESVTGPAGPVDLAVAITATRDDDGSFQVIDLAACGVAPGGGELRLVYTATVHESVEEVVFSRENVGNEITATISDEGIYLSGMAEWLAWGEGLMAVHDISCETPPDFETVTQGRRVRHETVGDRLYTRWVAEHPADGLNLIANRYFVHEEAVRDGIVSQTFFLEDDARLRATYMERTKAYIAMYEEMIGPYPYAKFATVENWFPTGYGMPSYTLLGSQVLRLPFIPYTSFGHEIAHNWWGNSVFVDLSEGNWCEGLTVYCADYHYKELEDAEQARQYRRTVLKDYAAYVKDPANDFPLSQFLSRHSGATRAVGYGKSMMVFHMVDRLIGREAFIAGLQAVAAEHRFRKAAWSDFLAAFEKASGQDLEIFAEQWLDRTGAPRLNLENVVFEKDQVSFDLVQTEPAYDLEIPVVTRAGKESRESILRLKERRASFSLDMEGIKELAIDPDCHVFRRLHSEEIEPTMSRVLAEDNPTLVLDGANPMMAEAARAFADDFIEATDYAVVEDGQVPLAGAEGLRTNLVINPGPNLLARYPIKDLVISGSTAYLAGQRFDLKKNDLVFCAANPGDPEVSDLIVLSSSTYRLKSLARRLGHYGKYSYLVFPAGQGQTVKGNWEPGASPLVARP